MEQVTVGEDLNPTLFPEPIPNRVTTILASSEVLYKKKNDMASGSADKEWAMMAAQFEDKYRGLVGPFLSPSKSEALLRLLWNMELEENLSNILAAMVTD